MNLSVIHLIATFVQAAGILILIGIKFIQIILEIDKSKIVLQENYPPDIKTNIL